MDKRVPLMYHDGTQWRKWECYKEKQLGVAIFVGGGPSLNKIDVSKLTGPGKTVFGVNTTYPTVRPDIWVGMDDPACYDRRLFHEPFPKVMRGNYHGRTCEGVDVKTLNNMFFAGVSKGDHKGDIFDRIGPDTSTLLWQKNVFVTTMNLILYMGFRDIYLAGVDFSLEEGHYHHGSELPNEYKDWNENLYNHLYNYVDWLASTGGMCGVNIKSISPESKINDLLEYVPLESLNESLKTSLPEAGKLYHCGEIDPGRKAKKSSVVSEEYKKLLQHEHSTTQWGIMAGNMIGILEGWLRENNAMEVLDYGAGSSSFKKALTTPDIAVYEYDPGVPGIDHTPEPRDHSICIDVLEHIEPNLIDGVIEDLARVTKVSGYFTIAMYPAKRILKDGRNAHLIIEDMSWWMNKLCKHFNVIRISEKNKQLDVEVEPK